jgi:hypothetical protein
MQCLDELSRYPHFAVFGGHIKVSKFRGMLIIEAIIILLLQDEKGEKTDARSRVGKVMAAILPPHLQITRRKLSDGGSSSSSMSVDGGEDAGGIMDIFHAFLTLSPAARQTLEAILKLPVFVELATAGPAEVCKGAVVR